jgi:cation/acetate symporter
MIYEASAVAVAAFFVFVGVTMGLSFYLGRKAKSSAGYFAAHGQIPWFVNGIAFAGDYLSAASFLGICGMIALYGYDGFLYSIGYLAGWIVALFVIAEPMKRLGKFTFADALDANFQSRGIKLAAGISTLAVSVFYLIPQMVGAGALITPLLGFPHWVGVVLVGAVVIYIVVSAGMVSTTWVQFLKGSLLVIFSAVLTLMILNRGLSEKTGGSDGHEFRMVGPLPLEEVYSPDNPGAVGPALRNVSGFEDAEWVGAEERAATVPPLVASNAGYWSTNVGEDGQLTLREAQTVEQRDGITYVNGQPKGVKKGEPELHPVGFVSELGGDEESTGSVGPLEFFQELHDSTVILWKKHPLPKQPELSVYVQVPTAGADVLRPGRHPSFAGLQNGAFLDKINFLSLMLALFCGTASLPHILIRYYTVKDEAAARKSTIVGIAAIGFFYVLTLYIGLGAMTSGSLDVTDSGNMAAPLLAKSMNEWLFAVISAIAFTTVLGTVSGLILASAGAVTHDLLSSVFRMDLSDHDKVRIAKIASVVVGGIAILLGILFKNMNVSYLVGWAFSVAASANLPSLVMLLFWKRTTKQGIIAAVTVGMVSSLAWVMLSADTITKVYGIPGHPGFVPFSQPGIVTIPLGFLTLVVVSLMTQPKGAGTEDGSGMTREQEALASATS